jgi:trans-2,3-dihydro-3-hydroxyanthranilate isomerase
MFADRPFAGSALAVVLEAEWLSTEAMQAIAREVNVAETAFVLPPSSPAASYRVRIFTPTKESPFGGHSSIGTASTLSRLGKIPFGRVVQECGTKLLSLSVTGEGVVLSATGAWQCRDIDPSSLTAACWLNDEDIVARPRAVGFGPVFHYLPVRPEAVARARLNVEQMRSAELADVFVFSWDSRQRTAHARLFAPGYEIPEDPACSSAALGLGLWLVDAGLLPDVDGTYEYRIHQGIELDRPSTLACEVTVCGGRAAAVSVTGRVVPTIHGHIAVLSGPPPETREVAHAES